MVFFNFLTFFAIFLEFSITRRVRTERNEKFLFFLILSLLQPIVAEMKTIMVFFNLLNFFFYFFEILYYARGWNETER